MELQTKVETVSSYHVLCDMVMPTWLLTGTLDESFGFRDESSSHTSRAGIQRITPTEDFLRAFWRMVHALYAGYCTGSRC